MAETKGKPIIDALTDNVLNTRFENIDAPALDNTKRRIFDMVGDIIGGAACDGSQELADIARGWAGKEEATVLGYGFKASIPEAAFLNAIFGRSFDRGPLTIVIEGKWGPYTIFINNLYINRFASHISETTVPVALAVAESKRVSGKELITSLIVGDDISARLHICNDRTPPGQAPAPGLPQPPPMRGSSDTFGAAAITGRLLGLNAAQMKQAFGLALTFMGSGGGMMMRPAGAQQQSRPAAPPAATAESGANPGWKGVNDPYFKAALAQGGYQETTSTKLMQGIIARNGINAAQLAKAGWTSVPDAFFGERGGYYPGVASIQYPNRITDDLGKKYYVEQVFKPWPGGRPTNQCTQSALGIVNKYNPNTDDIDDIILHLSKAAAAIHYSKPYMIGDYPTMNALWSFYFAIGNTLYFKGSRDENFTEKKIRDPKLQALIKKVRLGDLDKDVGVELEVKMKDGTVYKEYVAQALGEPYLPMSRDQLVAKFTEQVEFSKLVSKANMNKLIEVLENIEDVKDITQITKLATK